MRLILALSALLLVFVDPSEPGRLVTAVQIELALYTVYSGLLYVLSLRGSPPRLIGAAHWIDVAWYLLLVTLSDGTNSNFFFFFFFAILVASFRRGYITGLRVTFVSAVLFTGIGYAATQTEFVLNRFLLRPTYLLALGYMISYWGGSEIMSKRRLALLREVNKLSNPRFGLSRTIGSIAEQIRAFYDADACVLIVLDSDSSQYLLRRADRLDPERAVKADEVSDREAQSLLTLPDSFVVAFDRRARDLRGLVETFYAYDLEEGEQSTAGREESRNLSRVFNATSFISAPVLSNERAVGRLFVTSSGYSFTPSDADFLSQLVEQAWQMVRNVELLDRLATEAASQERLKIARDLHDSPIQDYLALKFQLEALSRTITPENPAFDRINGLAEKANEYVGGLRRFVASLTYGGGRREDSLLLAVRQEAAKCKEVFGIHVEVRAESDVFVTDRLASQALQIVREGLSNIKRHTQSKQAVVAVVRIEGNLVLQISNETDGTSSPVKFVPRSITERANSLGGNTEVEQQAGFTTVTVRIPL